MIFYRRKYVFFLSCALLVGVALAFHQFVHLPQRAALEEKQQQTADMERQIREAKAFFAQREDPAAYAKALAARRERNERLLPPSMETSDFLGDIEAGAALSGVRVTGVKPGKVAPEGGLFQQKIEVSTEGDYFQILDFLSRLEQGQRFVTVERLSGSARGQGVFACQIGLLIYATKGP